MSDTMLLGVLRMPIPDAPNPLTLHQFIDRARQAADRIEADAERIAALEAALAERDRVIKAARADMMRWYEAGYPYGVTESIARIDEVLK